MAWSSRSSNRRRLGSPVRLSKPAWRASSSALPQYREDARGRQRRQQAAESPHSQPLRESIRHACADGIRPPAAWDVRLQDHCRGIVEQFRAADKQAAGAGEIATADRKVEAILVQTDESAALEGRHVDDRGQQSPVLAVNANGNSINQRRSPCRRETGPVNTFSPESMVFLIVGHWAGMSR